MGRSGATRAADAVVTLLLAALPALVLAALRARSPIALDASPLAWLPSALSVALVASGGVAVVDALAAGLRRGSAAALLSAGASAALAGGGVAVLTSSASLALPVLSAAAFLGASALVGEPTFAHGRSRAIVLASIALLVAEASVIGAVVPVTASIVASVREPILIAGTALALLSVLGRPGAAGAALAVGGLGLLADRGGSIEATIGLASLVASQLLTVRPTLEAPREPDVAIGTRLPDLARRLSDPVLRFDGSLALRDWNGAAADLLGLDPASTGTRMEDLLGVTVGDLPAGDETAMRRALGGLEVAIHRSGRDMIAVIRDPGVLPETDRLGNELRATIEELLRARRTIDLQRGELERASTVDALTGVGSRGAILDRLRLEVAQARRYQHPLAVVLLDIDRFGEINRALGIAGGDAVLREVALRIRLRVREADALGRSGSDGFLAALPHTDEAGAATFADALRHRLAQRPIAVGDALVSVTVSIGIATMRPGEDLDLDAVLARVDEALASARSAGGDRIALDRRHGLVRLEDRHREEHRDEAAGN